MRRGFATAFVMNGSAAIHDFEIAIAGHTSEDVEAVLPDGRFGAAEETGREMNEAIAEGARGSLGMGEALGSSVGSYRRSGFRGAQFAAPGIRAGNSGDGPRRYRDGYTAHSSGGRRGGDRGSHASRFPAVLFPGDGAKRRRRVSEPRIGGGAAGGLSPGALGGAESGKACRRFHHRQSRFPAALSTHSVRGGAASRQRRGTGHRAHRSSRADGARCWRPR